MKFIRFWTLFVSLAIPCIAFAQSTNASLTGVVDDPSKAVIPKVSITAINTQTGIKAQTYTNSDGQYVLVGLIPGTYRVEVDKQGFKGIIEAGLVLHVQDILQINFHMAVGSMSETVTVTAEGVNMNTSNGSVSTVIGQQFIEDLPLNGRSLDTLFELTPGVVPSQGTNSDPGGIIVNGQRDTANNLTVDGVSANLGVSVNGSYSGGSALPTSASGGTNGVLPVDAIEEYRIQTSTYSAEFGRNPGGQIQVKSRGGTDQFHGSLFEYFRNQVMDATDWFVKHDDLQQPPLRMNDFGGTLGGPILKSKLFFFVAHETLLMHQPQFTSFDVPGTLPSGTPLDQAASPVFQPLLAAFPSGNGGADSSNPGFDLYNDSYSNIITSHSTSARADYNLSDKLHLFERVNIAPSAYNVNTLPNGVNSKTNFYTSTTGLTATLSSSVTNDLTFGYAHSGASQNYYLQNGAGSNVATAQSYINTLFNTNTGTFTFLGPAYITYGVGTGSVVSQNLWNIIDSVTAIKGRHTIKFGVDYRRVTPAITKGPFMDLQTGENALSTVETGIVEALYYGAFVQNTSDRFSFLYNNLSFFGQDTWKATDRLTLDYGLRWEINPPPTDGHGGPLAAIGNVQDPAALQLAPSGTPLWKTRYANLAPRLGFAYIIRKQPGTETVIRGGAGTFYDTGTSSAAINSVTGAYPYGTFGSLANLPFQQIDFSSVLSSATGTTLPQYSLSLFDRNLALPRTYQWSLAIEQQMFGKSSLSVSYVGNDGEQLTRMGIYNDVNPNATNLYLTTNGAHANYQALQAQVKVNAWRNITAIGNFTWSHALDDADTEFTQVKSNIASNWASSSNDIRHVFSGALHWSPAGTDRTSLLKGISNGWSLDSVAVLEGALPLTAIASYPSISAPYTGRADIVPNVSPIISDPSAPGGKRLNPAAFVAPPTPREGTSGRDAYRLFGLTQWDLSASKILLKADRVTAAFRVDAFNILNIPMFTDINTYLPSSTFGEAQTTYGANGAGGPLNPVFQNGGPRNLQLSLKIQF